MFEYLMSLPWWLYCILVTLGGAFFGIAMRYADKDIEPSVFAAVYSGFATLILLVFLMVMIGMGEPIKYTQTALIVAVCLGPVFVLVDRGVIAMYRAGAPVSLAMPLIRTLLALITALIGIVVFAEDMDILKALGIIACSSGIFLMGQKKDEQKAE